MQTECPDIVWTKFKEIMYGVIDNKATEIKQCISNGTMDYLRNTWKIALHDGLFYKYMESNDSTMKAIHNKN